MIYVIIVTNFININIFYKKRRTKEVCVLKKQRTKNRENIKEDDEIIQPKFYQHLSYRAYLPQ